MPSNLQGSHVRGSDYHSGHSSNLRNNQSNSNLARKRAHRGFRSSISSLFDDERVSCSAIACFGVLASSKTEFLLRQAHPVRGTARRERPQSVVIGLSLLITVILFSLTFVLMPNDGYSERVTGVESRRLDTKPKKYDYSKGSVEHRSLYRISMGYRTLYNLDLVAIGSDGFEAKPFSAHVKSDSTKSIIPNATLKNDRSRYLEQQNNGNDDWYRGYYDYDYDDADYEESSFVFSDMSLGGKVRLGLVLVFFILYGTIGRRRRSRTRYFMIKAKLYDDRLYGRDLPAVALSSSRSDVGEIARTLSTDSAGNSTAAFEKVMTRGEYKTFFQEVEKCEESTYEAAVAHSLCGCYPTDRLAHSRRSENGKVKTIFEDYDENLALNPEDGGGDNECKLTYRFFSVLCCGRAFDRWLQCLGICSLAQEARETKYLVPKLVQRIDYLTHEGWNMYEHKLQTLRRKQNKSFIAHLQAISMLSKYILYAGIYGITITGLTLYVTVNDFDLDNLAVLLLTFGQSFLVIYAIQWFYCRLELSLDAVIKLFAAGFVLAVPTAYVIQGMIQTFIVLILGVFYLILQSFKLTSVLDNHAYTLSIIGELVTAYIIAAVTEELTKYLVYRSIEHPDLMLKEDWRDENDEEHNTDTGKSDGSSLTSINDGGSSIGVTTSRLVAADARTIPSRGRSITCAMVCVAVGLACAENVVYVYFAGGSQVQDEIVVLICRSLFPIHALCAAMQSVGVVKRDVELQRGCHIGKIIFPAIILHGTFDAILMIMSLAEESDNEDNLDISMMDLVACFGIFVCLFVGIGWYYNESKWQRVRLEETQQREDELVAGYIGG